jgi:ABC-type uncharacterized transport system ATPase subunit
VRTPLAGPFSPTKPTVPVSVVPGVHPESRNVISYQLGLGAAGREVVSVWSERAGKTTTLKMLSGLLDQTSGEVLVEATRPGNARPTC